jgi:hypothetical protein
MIECSGKNCKKKVKHRFTYDCGTGIQNLNLCDFHYNLDPVFKRHIKNIQEQ